MAKANVLEVRKDLQEGLVCEFKTIKNILAVFMTGVDFTDLAQSGRSSVA